jgi:hypothetical protein
MHSGKCADLETLVKKHFADLKGVAEVYTVQEGAITHVWTVVCSDSKGVEDAVYEREERILDEIGRGIDFHIAWGVGPIDGKPIFLRAVASL